MKGFLGLCFLVCAVMSILALSQPDNDTPNADAPAHESKATIEGLVRDVACPIQNLETTATHLSMKCLLACARKGSPLVILTKDGDLYLLISGEMPDQRQTLMHVLGNYARASGTVRLAPVGPAVRRSGPAYGADSECQERVREAEAPPLYEERPRPRPADYGDLLGLCLLNRS